MYTLHLIRAFSHACTNTIKVWNGVLETMEDIQKKHCSTSKYVEETLLGTIDQLIKEKGELLQVS